MWGCLGRKSEFVYGNELFGVILHECTMYKCYPSFFMGMNSLESSCMNVSCLDVVSILGYVMFCLGKSNGEIVSAIVLMLAFLCIKTEFIFYLMYLSSSL